MRMDRPVAHAVIVLFVAVIIGSAFGKNIARKDDVLAVDSPHCIRDAGGKVGQLHGLSGVGRDRPRLAPFFLRGEIAKRLSIGLPAWMAATNGVAREPAQVPAVSVDDAYLAPRFPLGERGARHREGDSLSVGRDFRIGNALDLIEIFDRKRFLLREAAADHE